MTDKSSLRTCSNGHSYYKSSDCPTCPICEKERKPTDGFLSRISAPARRAMEHAGISTIMQLATYSEKEIALLHGIGKTVIVKLKIELSQVGLSFKPNE